MVLQAVDFLKPFCQDTPRYGLVLGTGLGNLISGLKVHETVPYGKIPYFPRSTVSFHKGELIVGRLEGEAVLVMQGRFHYYEGYAANLITLPIRVMHALGVETLILTNAAGSIREDLPPGSIAVIRDHINLMGTNPLIGPYDPFLGERFPDMSEPYSRKLRQTAHRCADDLNLELAEVLYSAVSGPNFETAAEIRMLQTFGMDAVGMSVVPEVLVARQLGMDVLAFSAITDQTLPENMQPISHKQVARVAREIAPRLCDLIKAVVKTVS